MSEWQFIEYGEEPVFKPGVRVVGINMSNPPWRHLVPEGVRLITTADVPSHKLVNVRPTIEHAWGLIMALHRRLLPAASDAFGDRNDFVAPYQLFGRSLGIIGAGRIGEGCATIAGALGMHVMRYDPPKFRQTNPQPIVAHSDVLLVSCTLNETSRGLICKHFLRHVKPDALLVSIAPHEVTVVQDVITELRSGILRGAAFDDWPQSVLPDYKLANAGKLLITPHIGGSTIDARASTRCAVIETMQAWLREHP